MAHNVLLFENDTNVCTMKLTVSTAPQKSKRKCKYLQIQNFCIYVAVFCLTSLRRYTMRPGNSNQLMKNAG